MLDWTPLSNADRVINRKPLKKKKKVQETLLRIIRGSERSDVSVSPIRLGRCTVEFTFNNRPTNHFFDGNFVTCVRPWESPRRYFQAILSMSRRNEERRFDVKPSSSNVNDYQSLLRSISWTLLPFVLVQRRKGKREHSKGRYTNPWKEVQEYRYGQWQFARRNSLSARQTRSSYLICAWIRWTSFSRASSLVFLTINLRGDYATRVDGKRKPFDPKVCSFSLRRFERRAVWTLSKAIESSRVLPKEISFRVSRSLERTRNSDNSFPIARD